MEMGTSAVMGAGSGNKNLNKLCTTDGVLSLSTSNPLATYFFMNDVGYSIT